MPWCPTPLQNLQKVVMAAASAATFSLRATWRSRCMMHGLFSVSKTLRELDAALGRNVLPSTKSRDVSAVKWVCRHYASIKQQTRLLPWLTVLSTGLHRTKRSTKLVKALPLSLSALRKVCKTAETPVRLALKLAWLLSSRAGELRQLSPSAIQRHSKTVIMVQWTYTKSNPTGATRADHLQLADTAVSKKLFSELLGLCKNPPLLAKVLAVPKQTMIKAMNVNKVPKDYVQKWQRMDPLHRVRSRFTGHSLKRGRAAILWGQAASGDMEITELLHRLKHKSLPSAMAYSPCPAVTATALNRARISGKVPASDTTHTGRHTTTPRTRTRPSTEL
jgi:hypothetical protein